HRTLTFGRSRVAYPVGALQRSLYVAPRGRRYLGGGHLTRLALTSAARAHLARSRERRSIVQLARTRSAPPAPTRWKRNRWALSWLHVNRRAQGPSPRPEPCASRSRS